MSAPTDKTGAAATPPWMRLIREFHAIEVRPYWHKAFADGLGGVENHDPLDPDSWCLCGCHRNGGAVFFENFATEDEAEAFADQLRKRFPHLAEEVQ